MMREFNVECKIGPPQVAYREAITKAAVIDYTHKKQSGGSGQFAARLPRSLASAARFFPVSCSLRERVSGL